MDVREKSSSKKRLIDYYYLEEKIECPGEPLVYWDDIESAPTVDAVEVVRCRECSKWWQKKDTTWLCRGFGYCTECMMGCHADNYCSYGERKEV